MKELMQRGGARAVSVLAIVIGLVVAACQIVAGVESRSADPERGGCALPGGSGPQVRVANFVTSTDVVDVCIRAAGASWGEPLILNGGTGCGGSGYFASTKATGLGFSYGQVSVPFTAPASVVDVKMVAAGKTCADPGLTSASRLKLASGAVTTLVRLGGNGVPQTISAFPEAPPSTINGYAFRFVHAMPGVGPLDLGTPPSTQGAPTLPTTLETPILHSPVSFGTVPAPGTLGLEGAVSAQGYFTIPGGNTYNLVAGVHGTNPENAVFLMSTALVQNATFSLYAIGVPHSNLYFQEALICQEGGTAAPVSGQNPLLTTCTTSSLPTVTVDVFNTSLYGPAAPGYSARKAYLNTPSSSPIPGRDTDIMCLTELDFLPDIQALVAMSGDAGTNSFPYSYYVTTDEMTPPTIAAEQDGAVPPAVTAPPCGGAVDPGSVDSAFQCMEQFCSSTPDSGAGTLPASTSCLSSNCTGPLGALVLTYPTCYDCIVDRVASNQTYDDVRRACTTQNVAPWGFGGQVSQLILSRYPIVASDRFILPSTNYRQAVLYSRVQLPGSLQIDFYCTFLTSTLVAGEVPYVGAYGGSSTNTTSAGADGQYAAEQLYQAQLLAKWVAQKSGTGASGVPAIVAGDWRSGRGPGDGGTPPKGQFAVPVPLVEPTIDALFAAPGFVPATASQWAKSPQCNFCPESENPLNTGQTTGFFVAQPFLFNWPGAATATVSEGLLYTQPTISTPDVDAAVPPSQYFGVTVSVLRPQ